MTSSSIARFPDLRTTTAKLQRCADSGHTFGTAVPLVSTPEQLLRTSITSQYSSAKDY